MESIRSHPHRGFTLIELLVVLAIIIVVMAIVFTSQSSFNKTLTLTNTAYDVALTFRFAETYGLGSRAFGTAANTGYGLHFTSGTPGSFVLFADTYPPVGSGSPPLCHLPPSYAPTGPSAESGNCVYDAGQGEKVQDYLLGNGITIEKFCAEASGFWKCSTSGINSLDVVFSRPNPTPFMSENGSYSPLSPVTAACLELTSPQGGSKYVTVAASGEISANAPSCP
ncbi:type II secretion system protein [Candidatus Parcubacteria bacterium]|nr:type II secretion system protein [Candidatus Parcubacteria bacterium]